MAILASSTGRLVGFWLVMLVLRLAGEIDGVHVTPHVLGRGGHGNNMLQSGAGTTMAAAVLRLRGLRGGGDGGGMAEHMEEGDDGEDEDALPPDGRIVKGELKNGFRC